jgi:hypothetical protein
MTTIAKNLNDQIIDKKIVDYFERFWYNWDKQFFDSDCFSNCFQTEPKVLWFWNMKKHQN